MESHKHLQFKTAVMILIMIIAGPLGNVLLGKGMKTIGGLNIWPPAALAHTFRISSPLPAFGWALRFLC